MNAFYTAVRQVWGLFVEDASFSAGILVCVALAMFLLPHVGLRLNWRGPLLFLGLATVLLENVWRSALKRGAARRRESAGSPTVPPQNAPQE